MRYSDTHRFFFVHIPKCAGRSVIKAVTPVSRYPYDEMASDIGIGVEKAREEFVATGYRHAELGPIDPFHLPLPILEKHFPRTFSLIDGTASFAVVREPRARFVSALMQRMREHLGYASLRLEDPAVQSEALAVCEWLDGREAFADVQYVHFTRQIDYVDIDGQRVVDRIFAIDDMAGVEAWLRERGADASVEFGFERRQPKSWFKTFHPATRLAAKALPRPVRAALYPLWIKSGLFAPAAGQYEVLRFTDDVERFIERYYRADRELHEAVAGAAR